MRNFTIAQAIESRGAPHFDPSGPVLVEHERHLSIARELDPRARLLTEGAPARLVLASTARIAQAATDAGVPVVLEASGDDEIGFLAVAHRGRRAFWDDDTLRERLAWALDRGSADLDATSLDADREASELRVWIARMRTAERARYVRDEEAHRRDVQRLEQRAEAAEERVHELGAHIAAIEGTRAYAFSLRLQSLAQRLRGGRSRG